jgi:hypothetical protein
MTADSGCFRSTRAAIVGRETAAAAIEQRLADAQSAVTAREDTVGAREAAMAEQAAKIKAAAEALA